jgi:hypothetical protein
VHHGSSKKRDDFQYHSRFLEYLKLLTSLEENNKLFPKECRVCGRSYGRLSSYVRHTFPKAHVMEDCADTMKKPFTMMYRHCSCGNTLVMSLTEDIFPELDDLWAMLRSEAEATNKPLKTVVEQFVDQWDHYVITRSQDSDE